MSRILVCGGRDYCDADRVNFVLDYAAENIGVAVIIHGAARGADALAGAWASSRGVPQIACPADWAAHGKAAGPIRNRQMLDEHRPDYVISFPGGRGTADMMRRAMAEGVEVLEVTPA